MNLLSRFCLCAGLIATSLLANEYVPNRTNDTYNYSSGISSVKDSVTALSSTWKKHTDFGGFARIWVRTSSVGNWLYFSSNNQITSINFDAAVGTVFPTSLSPCNNGTVRIIEKNATCTVPAGTFADVIILEYSQNTCVDHSVVRQYYAKNIGIVQYEKTTIAGTQTYSFTEGKLDSILYPKWQTPGDSTVQGMPILTFATFPNTSTAQNLAVPSVRRSGVRAVTALKKGNCMLGEYNSSVYYSVNSGNTWSSIGRISDSGSNESISKFIPAGYNSAYAYDEYGAFRTNLYFIDPSAGISQRTSFPCVNPDNAEIVDLWVDKNNANHIKGVISEYGDSEKCSLYESFNGGITYTQTGSVLYKSIYDASIDPANGNHIIVGTSSDCAYVTFNSGLTWQKSNGFPLYGTRVNVFKTVFSPVNSNIIFAMGLDLDTPQEQGRNLRRMFRSVDGGLTFTPILGESDSVTIINGPVIWPHPTDASKMYFSHTDYNMTRYTVYFYEYDCALQKLTMVTFDGMNPYYTGLWDIAFNPADPRLIYFGFDQIYY